MATAKIEHGGATLAAALVEFQKEMPTVALDSENPHFKSKFTSLQELTGKVIPVLSKHGLAYSATPTVLESGFVVEAHLIHESGERLTAQFPVTETNPQKIGSALSYARRYLLASLTGVVAETDDDGNAASNPSATERKLDAARANPPAKTTPPAPSNEDPNRAKVRTWIGTDDARKKAANDAQDKFKKEGKSGADLWAAVASEVGA